MRRLTELLRYAVSEFGPLIVFLALANTVGIKPAIAATIAVILLDAARRRLKGIAFTRPWLLSNGLALGFGIVDLLSATPFMLRYEPVVTNLLTAGFFALGALGQKPLIQEFAENQGRSFREGADVRRFFQVLTFTWAGYFVAKACVYLWLARTMSFQDAVALRVLIGPVSLALMIALSMRSRPLFFALQRLGLLPPPPEPAA